MTLKKLKCRKNPRYMPFDKGRFRLSMGIISLNLDEWLEPDEYFYKELLEIKRNKTTLTMSTNLWNTP